MTHRRSGLLAAWILLAGTLASGQAPRKVIIDQDAMGPGGTDQDAVLVLIQSPQVEPEERVCG